MSRSEFSQRTQLAAYERSGGICECGCGLPFTNHPKERPEYDHHIPCALGGDNSLENCRALRVDCHKRKTFTEDLKPVVKIRREKKRRKGIEARKAVIPGSKGSGWKKPMNGPAYRVSS